MIRKTPIRVFEYGKLKIGDQGFKESHLNALLSYNELHNFEYFDGIRNGIQFKQYVGIVQVDGLTIEILPKADKGDDTFWREKLIKMLRVCRRLKADHIGKAEVQKHHHHLLEVYFEIYLTELQSLIHKGLIKKYRKRSGNLHALKGRLEFAANLRHNLVHKERFYTSHQVYDTNHAIHQILFKALKVVEFFTRGGALFDKTKRVILDFPEVNDIIINESAFENIPKGRKTNPYQEALEIARMLLMNYSPDISQGRERMLALLFDMNKLWEEFVLRMLKRSSRSLEIPVRIIGQDSKPFWGKSHLQPDIVLEIGASINKTVAIIDTKWKRPSNKSASMEDLRQMYAYNKFWDSKRAMLLYPGEMEVVDFKPFKNSSEEEHYCKMHYLGVNKLFDEDAYRGIIEEMVGSN